MLGLNMNDMIKREGFSRLGFARLANAAMAGTAIAALMTVSVAHAGGFALREQSAYGQGVSFAGVAAGGSLSSMFWNPATLSQVMGFETEIVGTAVFPISDVMLTTPVSFDEGDVGVDALVPASYIAYRLNDNLIFGVGVNGAFGLSTEYDALGSPIAGAGVAGTSEIFSINVNPNVAYQINDYVTVAVGMQIQYSDIEINPVALGAPPPTGALGLLDGDDISLGWTAGLHIMASENTEFGIGYRSGQSVDLDGTFSVAAFGGTYASNAALELPDMVTVGIRHKINDYWRVMAGMEWANWSKFDTVMVSGGPAVVPLPFDYNDGWFFSAGAEYMMSDTMTFRAGVGWEESPLDNANRTFRLPDDDRLWLSAGMSYVLNDRYSFDLGYSFLTTFDTEILTAAAGGPASNGPFGGEADANIHILSAALKIKLGGHETSEPVVAKY